MIFNIDKDLWFDNEKINIIVGEENLKKYKQNYDKYEQIKINKEDNWYPSITYLSSTCCNLKCKYCFAHEGTYDIKSDLNTFTYEEYVRTFELVYNKYKHVASVTFFGGEPMINYKEIEKFCEYLFENYTKEERPILGINTNATIYNSEIKNMIKRYGINFGTSLDGSKEHNDKFRVGNNVESVYEKVKSTLLDLSDVPVQKIVQMTISRIQIENYNKGDCARWMKEIGEMGVKCTEMIPVTTEDKLFKIDLTNKNIYKRYIDFCSDIFDYTIGELEKEDGKVGNCPRIVVGLLCRIMRREYQKDCTAGRSFTFVPQGRIYPCHTFAMDERYGEETKSSFSFEQLDDNEFYASVKYASREKIEKCVNCIGRNLCPFYCKGLSNSTYGDINHIFNERCIMLEKLIIACVKYLSSERFIKNRKNVMKNIGTYHKIVALYKG